MAAFASFAATETRVAAKGPAGDKTWVNAYAYGRNFSGAFCIYVQRYLTPSTPSTGQWVEITDDATV